MPPNSARASSATTRSAPVAVAGRPRSLDQALSLFEKRAGARCRSDLESRIRVEVTIEASGRLGERRVLPPHEMTSTAVCILGVLDAQKFPATKGGVLKKTITVHSKPL